MSVERRTPRMPDRDDADRDERRRRAQALAEEKRGTLLRRSRRVRRSVAALTVTLFVAAFATIYVQLASGNDPALKAAAQRHSATSSGSSGSSSSGSGGSSSEEASGSNGTESSSSGTESSGTSSGSGEAGSGGESESSSSIESSSPSSVRTSQS